MRKAAVIGFGFMGMTHALNILKISDLKLSAIVERDLSVINDNLKSRTGNIDAGSLSEGELSSVKRYSDFEKCIQSEDFDVAVICTHVNTHFELTRHALLNNKNVFLEKPFCLDIEQAAELIGLASDRNKLLMIGHVVRFMPPYQKLKHWIGSGEYGDIKFLSLSRYCGLPGWGQWNEKDVKDSSGGALFDLVIHDIDFAASVLGKPDKMDAVCLPGEYSNHDYISALWSYNDSDLRIRIDGGFNFHRSFPFQAGYMAHFEKASISYSTAGGGVIKIADDNSVVENPAGDPGAGYLNEMNYFTECLTQGLKPELCTPQSSLLAIELCYKHL